jgi:bacterioferritin-associated ferredoxin
MIVCSCNVLTDAQVLETLGSECPASPRTPGQAYRCLGCDPCCGRCLTLINQILREARGADAVQVGCDTCPGAAADEPEPAIEPAVLSEDLMTRQAFADSPPARMADRPQAAQVTA